MNKNTKRIARISILGAASLSLFLLTITHNEKEELVDAYTVEDLPTTIDLNDTSEANIRNYYSSLNVLSQSERQGTNLLKNLKTILKNGQKYYSYDDDNGKYIWQMYEITDRDWEKSPASNTVYGTYNSSTNKITGYTYGTSLSNTKNNPYLHALYVNRDVNNEVRAWDNHNQDQWGINREHIWAKSHGIDDDSSLSPTGGARGDPMHLWSGNGYVNGFDFHSNYFFGFVDKSKTYSDAGSTYSNLSNNLQGKSLSLGGSTTVFEPQDSDKGDIARAIFYMAARYNYLSGGDSDDINSNNPNLTIVDRTSDSNGSSSYISSKTKAGQMGIIRDLLAWNRLDPPDEWEIHRNNLLYTNFTNNRNPFIDYPEWAEFVWGSSTLEADNRTISDYNSSSTGYAQPNSDTVGSFDDNPVKLSLDKTSVTLDVGDIVTITATAQNGTGDVSWTTSDASVASLSASIGNVVTVTAESTGSATITASYSGLSKTCAIAVAGSLTSDYSLTVGSPYINDVPYKMYFYSTSNSTNYYFTGDMSGSYGATTTTVSGAKDIYFEENGAGQNIYFFDQNSLKQYLFVNYSSNKYYFKYSTSIPSNPWIFKTQGSDYACMTYQANDNTCTFGTYGTFTTFNGYSLDSYTTNYEMDFISSDTTGATALMEFFMDYLICNASGTSAPGYRTGISWSSFEDAYKYLDVDSKSTLSVTLSDQSGTTLEQGLARYDYILGKYNTSSTTPYNDFLGRISSGRITLNSRSFLLMKFNSLSFIFIGTFAIICGAGCFIIVKRKRKHN